MKPFIYFMGLVFIGVLASCSGNSSNSISSNTSPDRSSNVQPAPNPSPVATSGSDIQKGNALFQADCSACHNVNIRLIGPPLKGITKNRKRQWIYNWIHNSSEMISSGDTAGINLFKSFNQIQMTSFPNLTDQDIDNILVYIKSQEQ